MQSLHQRIQGRNYIRLFKFFRQRLLTILDPDEVVRFIESYDKQARALKQEALKMCWFMRGGLSYAEAMNLSYEERQIVGDLVKENIEVAKKTGLPFF